MSTAALTAALEAGQAALEGARPSCAFTHALLALQEDSRGRAANRLAALASAVLLALAMAYRVPVALNASAVLACAVLVAVLSLLSGLGAMRSLLRADPATLLR